MKKLFLFAAVAALLTSCGNETLSITDYGKRVPLTVTASSVSAMKTKAATLISEGNIGIFLLENAGSGYVGSLSQYSYGSAWAANTATDIIFLNNNNADLCAYFPYDSTILDATAIPLTSAKFTAAKDISFNTKLSTANNTDESVDFTMNHAYSQIKLDITKDVTYNGTGAVGNISISNAGIISTSTLNIWDGVYGTGISATVSYDAAISAIASTATVSTNVLMVPVATAMTGNIVLTFTVDGVVMTATMAATNMPVLAAGSVYQIAVTLKGTLLVVTSVSVTDWTVAPVTGEVVPTV